MLHFYHGVLMKLKLFVFVFLWSFCVMSQEKVSITYSNTLLTNVISDLESKFNIKLSFNSDLILNKVVTFTSNEATLIDVFRAIETQTDVVISELSSRYYIIEKQTKVNLSDTQELDEVVINEYLTSGIREDQDESIRISPKKLGILPGLTEPDVLQSIQLIPGVQSPTETASGLYIRGGTPDQNLILWDGIKMYHSGHFFGTVSAFNPYITQDVKLYKNGTKARYGNRVSSVVDITSDNSIPLKTEGGFGFNMTHVDLYLKIPLSNKFAIIASARRSFIDAFETPTFQNLSERVFQSTKISEGNKVFEDDQFIITKDLFYFTDVTLKAIIEPNDKNKITISNLITKNKLDYGFLIEEFEEASKDKLDINNRGYSISWDHNYNNKLSQNISAYYSSFELEYSGSNSIPEEFLDQLDKQNTVKDLGFSYDTNWLINSKNKINLGYQFSSNKVKYSLRFQDSENQEEEFLEQSDETNKTHAFFTEYSFENKNKWFLNIGLRTNHMSVLDKFLIEPRLQVGYNINENLKLKASLEVQHQAVSQIEEFQTLEFGLENQVWALTNNDNIPLLKSNQFTTGFLFKKRGWSLDVDTYYKSIKGLTSFTRGFDRIGEPVFSEGESDVFGLDFLLTKKINKYRTWLSYSYINNDFSFSNLNSGESFPGNFDITHQLSWSHSYEWKNFNASLGWVIRSGIPYTEANGVIEIDNETFVNYDKINSSRLSAYHRLDISATYKFNVSKNEKWKGKLGLSLINLYNKKNDLNKTFRKKQNIVSGSDILRKIDKTSLGITPNLVFRLEF